MAYHEFFPKTGDERLQRAKFIIHYDPKNTTDNTAIKECKQMVGETGDLYPLVGGAIPSQKSYELTCLKEDSIKKVEWLFMRLDIPTKAEYERRKKEEEEKKKEKEEKSDKQVRQAS